MHKYITIFKLICHYLRDNWFSVTDGRHGRGHGVASTLIGAYSVISSLRDIVHFTPAAGFDSSTVLLGSDTVTQIDRKCEPEQSRMCLTVKSTKEVHLVWGLECSGRQKSSRLTSQQALIYRSKNTKGKAVIGLRDTNINKVEDTRRRFSCIKAVVPPERSEKLQVFLD